MYRTGVVVIYKAFQVPVQNALSIFGSRWLHGWDVAGWAVSQVLALGRDSHHD